MAEAIELRPNFLSANKTYESCLGQGAFGVVLKALDTSDTPTAIKFIFLDNYDDADQQKLLREYELTKDLEQHSNVVKVINVQEKAFSSTEIEEVFKEFPPENLLKAQYIARANVHLNKELEAFCIQMELCGENLRDWLNKRHNVEDSQIKQTKIIEGMISGLRYLHKNKIIHRDLKPENIMFSKDGYRVPIKIGDFGHSRRIHSDKSKTGSLTAGVGTTLYMAPEVHSGDYDHQADLYSLGLIIWEVSQLIEPSKRRHLFDKLVNDKEEKLVEDHPIMTGIKKIIIEMTKRNLNERTKTLNDIQIENWDQEELLQEDQSTDDVFDEGLLNEIHVHTPLWEASTNSDSNLTVKTSEEFKSCLDNAQPGDIINLDDGDYQGPFILRQDSVQIIGNGSGTVLRSNYSACLIVSGSGCTISGFKIGDSDNGIGIIVHGSKNTIKEVDITDTKDAIIVEGNQNTVDHVTMTNLSGTGIEIKSNGNTISNITGLNVKWGIIVGGSNNDLTNISFQRGTEGRYLIGVSLNGAAHNRISNLTCAGYSKDKDDWGLILRPRSSNYTVVDSVCGPVWVLGGYNLTLNNVHCGDLIEVGEGEGVQLIKCRGKMLKAPKTVKVSNCQFEEKVILV